MVKTSLRFLNLTDQIFAVVENTTLFGNPGQILLNLLTRSENPLPDLEGCWRAIQGKSDQCAHDQHSSRLLMLPQEVFLCVIEFCGNYEDVLQLSFTCRKALGKLVPLATAIRNNLGRTVCLSNTYVDQPWNGKRVAFMLSGQSQDAPFLEHVRSKILAAARKRGQDEKHHSVSGSLRLLEDVHLMRREAEEGKEGLGSSLPPDVFRRTIIETKHPRKWYLPHYTTLYPKTHYIAEPPAVAEYHWPITRSDVKTAFHKLRHHVDPSCHYRDRLQDEMQLKRSAEEELDHLRQNGDLTGSRLRRQINCPRRRPYRIVNLDTLEHMDSSTVISHFPKFEPWCEDAPTFVLWVHVCYDPKIWTTGYGRRTQKTEFGKGRWAGHRLRYETVEFQRECDLLCTTDISLEMISLAVDVKCAQQVSDPYRWKYL